MAKSIFQMINENKLFSNVKIHDFQQRFYIESNSVLFKGI